MSTINIRVTDDQIESAKERRKAGDKLYGHLANTRILTPDRWVGDLGEIIMHCWLDERGIKHTWFPVTKQRTEPDFLLKRDRVYLELKTKGRHSWVQGYFKASVALPQYLDNDHTDEYFFMSYHKDEKVMQLLGYMSKPEFGERSVIFLKGEYDDGWQTRFDERNVAIKILGTPTEWLVKRAI